MQIEESKAHKAATMREARAVEVGNALCWSQRRRMRLPRCVRAVSLIPGPRRVLVVPIWS